MVDEPGAGGRRQASPSSRRPGRSRLSARIATVAGVDIRIHASFLLLVALVAVGSSSPEGPGPVAGLLWLAALFACVVVHELAHSLVAVHHGIPIVEIELLPIGGISKMERTPADPAVDLRIAAAGPAASVALAALFAGTALLAGIELWPPTLYGGGVLARLAWVNLLLGGFNLIPALPLDGGRVLRAVLEERTDHQHATQVAARAGRLFGSVMIAAGFLFDLWLLVIGVFVYVGSRAEETAALLHERVKDLTVRDVMILDPVALHADTPTSGLTEILRHSAQREFPVIDESDRYVGIVTAGELARAGPGTTVAQVADPDVHTLAPDDPLESSGLLDGPRGVAAVLAAGRVVGLARAADAWMVVRPLLQPRPATAGQDHGRS